MVDRGDDLEELAIELLYWARDCYDRDAARKMRAAAEMLTDAVKLLRTDHGTNEIGDIAERGSHLSFVTSHV